MAGQEAVDNRQMASVAGGILLEDPLAGGGAEAVHPAVVREQPRRCTDGRATHRKLAGVAHHGERFGRGARDVPLAHILGVMF